MNLRAIAMGGVLALGLCAGAGAQTRCFFFADDVTDEGVELTRAPDGTFWGQHFGNIHSEAQGYYASFETWLIDGTRGPDGRVTFETITLVDGDTQYGDDVWTLGDAVGPASRAPYLQPAPCTGLDEKVFGPAPD